MAKTFVPKLPKPASIDPAEREYFRLLRGYVRSFVRIMNHELEGALPFLREQSKLEQPRVDSIRLDTNIERTIRDLFERVISQLEGAHTDSILRKWAESMVTHVNRISKKNTVCIGKAVDLEVEPLMRDKELTPYFQNIVDENVGLIKSIPRQKLETLKNKLVFMITKDDPQDRIREMLQAHFKATYSQARLIARDQTNKLNGAVNQYRQKQLGVKRYRWRTVHDSRVREDHEKLDGKIFSWAQPPIVDRRTKRRGHPGYDFQCRCYAEAILEDILE